MATQERKLKNDSIALANYFIDKGVEESADITLLKLVKLVYIAHGYLLALLDKSFLNSRFDRVEAWKFGPVIPTVYHTFKYNGGEPIRDKGVVCQFTQDEKIEVVTPQISDDAKIVLDFVWKRYGHMEANTLVSLLHRDGTPWKKYYIEGMNVEIPDNATKDYYTALFRALVSA